MEVGHTKAELTFTLVVKCHHGDKSIVRAGRVELLQEASVGEVEDPIFGPGSMLAGVLAEVLELFQLAYADRLSEQQEQPVDATLLAVDDRLGTLALVTHSAVQQTRDGPHPGRPVVHGVLM